MDVPDPPAPSTPLPSPSSSASTPPEVAVGGSSPRSAASVFSVAARSSCPTPSQYDLLSGTLLAHSRMNSTWLKKSLSYAEARPSACATRVCNSGGPSVAAARSRAISASFSSTTFCHSLASSATWSAATSTSRFRQASNASAASASRSRLRDSASSARLSASATLASASFSSCSYSARFMRSIWPSLFVVTAIVTVTRLTRTRGPLARGC